MNRTARATFVALSLLVPAGAAGPGLLKPLPGQNLLPPYRPTAATGADLLAREARWIRNMAWTTGDVADASTFLFPRSYDVTSGYGILGTDFFSWMLQHNRDYWQYDHDHDDHAMDVPRDHSNDAVLERVMMAWGADAYDMGCWSLAMSAAARNKLLPASERQDCRNALTAYHRFLVTSSYPGGFQYYRAYGTSGPNWLYGESGDDPAYGVDDQGHACDYRNAYIWQFTSPRWQNPDPAWVPPVQPGAVLNWPGWAAVTGEEAWAIFLGPLQAAWNQGGGAKGWSALTAPLDAPALLENACRALHAVSLMQNSATGALYHHAAAADSPDPKDRFGVSTENNWSMYAGLGMLERALEDFKASVPGYKDRLPFDLDASLATVKRLRGGMRDFFTRKALVWHAPGEPFGQAEARGHAFFLSGTAGEAGAAKGNRDTFATDVQTWGIAAILADRDLERRLEGTLGEGFLDQMFQSVVDLAAYRGPDGELMGVGYTRQAQGAPGAVLSGEWTWGAVNAAIALADFHKEPAHADPAKVKQLLAWARELASGVTALCSHDYAAGGRDWVGYLYANDRVWIPWGWWANPCPSQAATAWALMVNAGFDPFEPGGGHHQETAQALGLAGGLD